MRTTLNIEDNVLMMIKDYAEKRDVSLGRAVSDLVQRGAETMPRYKKKNGWVQFESAGARRITGKMMDAWEKADYKEESRRAFSPRR